MLLNERLTHPAGLSARWRDYAAPEKPESVVPPSQSWKPNWLINYDSPASQASSSLHFHLFADGSAECRVVEESQQQEFIFHPVPDGIRIQLRFTTHQAIRNSYCLQQCLRFTGQYNAEWRRSVAYVPFLSELDMQAMGNPNGTLTYALRDHQWFNFPVPHSVYPVLPISLDLPGLIRERIDNGLIIRETPDRSRAPASYFEKVASGASWDQITTGMFWERTVLVSNRHPADCLHAWVDIGPLEPEQTRTLHGKIYFIEGSKEDLLAHWREDFE